MYIYIYIYVCVCVSIVQNWLVNLVPAYSRTMVGDFSRFSNANIFGEWLERHIRHICPYGTQPEQQESVDRFSISAAVQLLGAARRITLT